MASTTQITVTKQWTALSTGDCTIQAVELGDYYDIAVSDTAPTGAARIVIQLDTPVGFSFGAPVYCKLSASSKRTSAPLNVIK